MHDRTKDTQRQDEVEIGKKSEREMETLGLTSCEQLNYNNGRKEVDICKYLWQKLGACCYWNDATCARCITKFELQRQYAKHSIGRRECRQDIFLITNCRGA